MRDTIDFLLHDWLRVDPCSTGRASPNHSRETFDASARHLRAHRAREVRAVQSRGRYRGAALRRREGDPAAELARRREGLCRVRHAGRGARPRSSAACSCRAWSRWRPTRSSPRPASALGGGGLLTSGNANLLMAHGTPRRREVFAKNEFAGRWFGTMCLSEPQAGSSLSDIATRALPDGGDFENDPLGPRYRLRGNKMWISNGEHELDREHRASGAGQDPRRRRQAGSGHQGHLAVHRAEETGRCRRHGSPASATTWRWPA